MAENSEEHYCTKCGIPVPAFATKHGECLPCHYGPDPEEEEEI